MWASKCLFMVYFKVFHDLLIVNPTTVLWTLRWLETTAGGRYETEADLVGRVAVQDPQKLVEVNSFSLV